MCCQLQRKYLCIRHRHINPFWETSGWFKQEENVVREERLQCVQFLELNYVPQDSFIQLLRPVGRSHYKNPVVPSRLHLRQRNAAWN